MGALDFITKADKSVSILGTCYLQVICYLKVPLTLGS